MCYPSNHIVEFSFDPGLEVRFDLVNFCELSKGLSAIPAKIIDARYPVGLHGRFLFLGILTAVTFDFDDKMNK